MEEVQSQILSAILALVGTVLSWAAVSARNYFRTKVDNEYVSTLLLRLTDAVEVGVRDVSNTLVPQIIAANADGKITVEEAQGLRDTAREATFEQLTKVDRAKLENLFDRDQLERKLDRLIEAAVHRLKEGQKSV